MDGVFCMCVGDQIKKELTNTVLEFGVQLPFRDCGVFDRMWRRSGSLRNKI
jgi:hypothetical protein